MIKIASIIIAFIFILSDIGYSMQESYCLLRSMSLFQKKPGKPPLLSILDLTRQRQWRARYHFSVQLPDNTVLDEPSGFPGKWVVSLGDGVEKEDNSMAQAMRLAKSFSISCLNAGRQEIERAYFRIVKELPEDAENIYSCESFVIHRDSKYGLKIFVHMDFLNASIPAQRQIFSTAIRDIPRDITYPEIKKMATATKKIKIAIFNNPFGSTASSSLVTPTALVLASMLKKEEDMEVQILRGSYKNIGNVDADAVIFSMAQEYIPQLDEFTRQMRKRKSNIAILCGGPAATIMAEHIAAHANELNVVYRGDADGRLDKLIRASVAALANPGSIPDIFGDLPGGIYTAGNTFYFNECGSVNRATKEELENRQFDLSILGLEYLKTPFSFMTGFGCDHGKCIFCATGAKDEYISMSPEKVADVAEQYGERFNALLKEAPQLSILGSGYLPFPVVNFDDDNIFADKPRVLKILGLLKKSKSGVRLKSLMGRLENLLIGDKPGQRKVDTEFLDGIANASGVFTDGPLLYFGTEHLVVPNEFGKGNYTYEEIQSIMEECEKRRIKNVHFQILTHPYMRTRALLMQTIRMIWCTAKYSEFTYFLDTNTNYAIRPFLCTPIYNRVIRNGDTGLIIDRSNYKPASLTQVSDFPEYDYYDPLGTQRDIFSKFIPFKINTNYSFGMAYLARTALRDERIDYLTREIKLLLLILRYISEMLDSNDRENVLDALDQEVIGEWLQAKSILEGVDGYLIIEIEKLIEEIQTKTAKLNAPQLERNLCRSQI